MSEIPVCVNCGVEHPWLLNVNEMANRVSWQCNECGWHQTTDIPVRSSDVDHSDRRPDDLGEPGDILDEVLDE